MNHNSTYYSDMLGKVREQILESVRSLIEKLGGEICTEYYHSEKDTTRFTFFDTNNDGYGVELFVSKIKTDGDKITFYMSDSEDTYSFEWQLSHFDASNALYLLEDLEEIADCVEIDGGEVVKDYPDYV